MTVHELSRLDARRIAVRAQLLDRPRVLDRPGPTGLLDVVRQLTLLQIDPVAAIAPSAYLVAWSRLGSSYSPAELDTALADRTLLELRAMIRPGEDLALYRADMARWDQAERGDLPGWRASRARRGPTWRAAAPTRRSSSSSMASPSFWSWSSWGSPRWERRA